VGGEPSGIVCRGEAARAMARQARFPFWVAFEPVGQTRRDDLALGKEFDRGRYDAAQRRQQERIVRAAEQNPLWRLWPVQHWFKRAAEEVFGAGAVEFAGLDHRRPEWAGFLDELKVGCEFAEF